MHELAYFGLGIIVGAMNAIAGGGGLVSFPAFIALGIPPLVANATNALIAFPGQISSAFGYRNYLRRVPKRFIFLLIPLTIGTAIGALVLRNTSAEDFAQIVPWLVYAGVLLFTVQPLLHFHLKQHLHGKHRTITPLFWIGLALLPVSFYGGYFGAGFGFMMLAFLSFARISDVHMMNAMKNVGATFVGLTVVICLFNSGLVDWYVGAIAAAGSLVGGYAGARYSQRLSSHWLRIIVIIIGFSAVIYLALQRY